MPISFEPPAGYSRRTMLAMGAAAAATACSGPPAGSLESRLRPADAKLMLEALEAAPSHGFRPDAFGALDTMKGADGDALRNLHQAIDRYARAMHGHAIPAKQLRPDWGLRPPAYDPEPELARAVQEGRVREWLEALPPPQDGYRRLRDAYRRYAQEDASGRDWHALPQTGASVQMLQARLAFDDPALAPQGPGAGDVAGALQRAQARFGLKPTGMLDAATVRALNVPLRARAAQLRANLERWRWMPRTLPAGRIEVNSAAALMDYYPEGGPPLRMLAAAGRPGDETPILASTIDTIVLNPPWKVPDTIAEKELFPRNEREPGYFEREGFVVDPPGEGVRLMQKPGPKCALGQVKFEFPNRYSVYLHDTPAKAAFSKAQRSVSHGCVRLQHAVELAKTLLAREPDWPPSRVDEVVASEETTSVKLSRPVSVRIGYWTAFVDGGGVEFRDDVYGWDVETLRLLDASGPGLA